MHDWLITVLLHVQWAVFQLDIQDEYKIKWLSDCCLTPIQQFFGYIMTIQ